MDLPIDPETPPVVAPGDLDTRPPLTCEFCQCRLSQRGEVLAMSSKAKIFIKQDMRIDEVAMLLQKSDAKIRELELEISRLSRPSPVLKTGAFLKG